MDASSLQFFQAQVASLEQELRAAQDALISDLENRTSTKPAILQPQTQNQSPEEQQQQQQEQQQHNENQHDPVTSSPPPRDEATTAIDWEAKVSSQEGIIETLTQELAEARSTCAFIIKRERDKVLLLSSTEDALMSCLILLVLESERDLPQFVGDFHSWNENRGVTGVLHVFSSWCAAYVEGQKSVVSQCLTWLLSKCRLVRIIHKNGFPAGSGAQQCETPMHVRKVPNCTLHVEWHTPENATASMSASSSAGAGGGMTKNNNNYQDDNQHQHHQHHRQQNAGNDEEEREGQHHADYRHQQATRQRRVVDSMIDTLGRAATECIGFAPIPTYLLSHVQNLQHDVLNPSRLVSTETFVYQPAAQGFFVVAVASHTPLDLHGASVANGTMRQRLQRAAGSCVLTPWGAGPIASIAVVVNHPPRNMLEEATALPGALSDALRTVECRRGGPFAVALTWCAHKSDEFRVINSAQASVIGWGVRKLRCMLQFAIENDERSVLTNAFVDRLTLLERQRIRLVARVRFHRCLDPDDVWAPPADGVMSSTAKSLDEQLRHVSQTTRRMVARRHGLQERRGLQDDVHGLEMMKQEQEAQRAESAERIEIENAFYCLNSLDESETVLVTDAVHYWMSADAEGLDEVVYPKLRRLMGALGIPHMDRFARVDLDKFFVVTFRLRHQ